MTDSDIAEKVHAGTSSDSHPSQPNVDAVAVVTPQMKFTRKQIALGVSLIFHAALLAVLFFWYLPQQRTTWTPPTNTDHPSAGRPDQTTSTANRDLPELKELEQIAQQQPEVKQEEIAKSIESQIEQTQELTDEHKLTELEKNLKRLSSVASEQSVQQVSSTIAESLGLDAEQYASKSAPVDGTFDTDSAQMSDVLRTKDEQGNWQYQTVMVDAQGHQMQLPLGGEDGARLYETFELMKRYPIAKGVYQSVVMPMMQKMLEGRD